MVAQVSTLIYCLLPILVAYYVTVIRPEPQPSCEELPTVRLANGVEMPLLQLGSAHLVVTPTNEIPRFRGMLPEQAMLQVERALKVCMTAFDSALIYRSQTSIGRVIGDWIRHEKITRKDVWITSKILHPADGSDSTYLGSQMASMPTMTPDDVAVVTRQHFEQSLGELNLGYVDLMLLHWPSPRESRHDDPEAVRLARQRRLEAWNVLQDMYDKGWARAIGVSNFSPTHIEQLVEDGARILPMVNQIEASVNLQHAEIRDYCLERGIVPQSYSPLGRHIRKIPPIVSEIGAKYGKNVGQISFRYLVQHGYSVTYLTTSAERMVSNTQIFDFELTAEEMKQLDDCNRPDGGWGLPNPNSLA